MTTTNIENTQDTEIKVKLIRENFSEQSVITHDSKKITYAFYNRVIRVTSKATLTEWFQEIGCEMILPQID